MKRFFTEAKTDENHGILLDDKPLHTPAKKPVILPNAALAEAVAAEWNETGEEIDKNTLYLTSIASLAVDIARPRRHELILELLEYGETDLMFYRSEDEILAEEQRLKWQPWLNRAQVEFQTRYEVTDSIMPVMQPEENKTQHVEALTGLNEWQLAILATVVKPTTSLLLGWFFTQGDMDADTLHRLARLEEDHNEKQWGQDEEAAAKAAAIKADLDAAERWRSLL